MHEQEFDPAHATSPHLSVNRHAEAVDPTMLQAATEGRMDGVSTNAMVNLQRLAGNSSVSSLLGDESEELSPVHDVVNSGGGSPLDSATRVEMEARLGHDFGDVRIHTGADADASAKSVNAQAYTVGTDVVFQNGRFAPQTEPGMHTLAHELTHVVQQKAGPVAGTLAPGGIRVSDPADSFEQAAERTADRVMTNAADRGPASAENTASIQRAAAPEEEKEDEVQSLAVERVASTGEEEQEDEAKT